MPVAITMAEATHAQIDSAASVPLANVSSPPGSGSKKQPLDPSRCIRTLLQLASAHVLSSCVRCPSLPYVMTSVAQYSPSLCGSKRGRSSPEGEVFGHSSGKRWRQAGYPNSASRVPHLPGETRRRLVLLIAHLSRMDEQVRFIPAGAGSGPAHPLPCCIWHMLHCQHRSEAHQCAGPGS